MIKGQRREAEYVESWSGPLFGSEVGVLFISEEQRKELGKDPDGRHGLLAEEGRVVFCCCFWKVTTSNLKYWILFEIINNYKKQVANKLSTFKNISLWLLFEKGCIVSFNRVGGNIFEVFI